MSTPPWNEAAIAAHPQYLFTRDAGGQPVSTSEPDALDTAFDREMISRHIRQSIRTGTPGTALGRIWQKHAVSMLDALESSETALAVREQSIRDALNAYRVGHINLEELLDQISGDVS